MGRTSGAGSVGAAKELAGDCPDLIEPLKRRIEVLEAMNAVLTSSDAPTRKQIHDKNLPASGALAPIALKVLGYEILGELGRGGMGVVYKARQIALDRLVAIKMILPGPQAGPEELARFRAEAEASRPLQHPNIVQIYEVGEADGRPFFSLEFVDGGTLEDGCRVSRFLPATAARLLQTLARAMHAAHQRGIIHRDLKPANILLQNAESKMQNGEPVQDSPGACIPHSAIPKITDFGLAKRLDAAQRPDPAAAPSWARPATWLPSRPSGKVQASRAGHRCLCPGRHPLRAAHRPAAVPRRDLLGHLQQVITAEPVPPGVSNPVPRNLETICLKCLQKDSRPSL